MNVETVIARIPGWMDADDIEEIDGFNCLSYGLEMFAMMRQSNFWQYHLKEAPP